MDAWDDHMILAHTLLQQGSQKRLRENMALKKRQNTPLLEQLYLKLQTYKTYTITLSTLLVYTTDYLYIA